jgi:hypothetical protein
MKKVISYLILLLVGVNLLSPQQCGLAKSGPQAEFKQITAQGMAQQMSDGMQNGHPMQKSMPGHQHEISKCFLMGCVGISLAAVSLPLAKLALAAPLAERPYTFSPQEFITSIYDPPRLQA